MPALIDFYFDFSSPYGYIASGKIDALAARHGREVVWRPFLLGPAFKVTGSGPLPQIPVKGQYAVRDMKRSASFHGLPFRFPDVFPISGVNASRAFYWVDGKDPARARDLARALYRAYWADNIDISNPDNVAAVAAAIGLDRAEVAAGMAAPEVKERTRAEVDRALAAGVFGSPYIVVDGEPFWGSDRLEQIDRWLATGGWQ